MVVPPLLALDFPVEGVSVTNSVGAK